MATCDLSGIFKKKLSKLPAIQQIFQIFPNYTHIYIYTYLSYVFHSCLASKAGKSESQDLAFSPASFCQVASHVIVETQFSISTCITTDHQWISTKSAKGATNKAPILGGVVDLKTKLHTWKFSHFSLSLQLEKNAQ